MVTVVSRVLEAEIPGHSWGAARAMRLAKKRARSSVCSKSALTGTPHFFHEMMQGAMKLNVTALPSCMR
jgi:hypothetical protein